MTNKLGCPTSHLPPEADRTFDMRFTSTPRGARLARRLAALRLDEWGIPFGTEPHDDIVLILAELTANAVRHGHVPGRDFHVRLHLDARTGTVRAEVTDTRAERLPRRPGTPEVDAAGETGRGLLLVSHLAVRWDWHPRPDGPGKTVWAEYPLPAKDRLRRLAEDAEETLLKRLTDEAEPEGADESVSLEERAALLRDREA